MPEHRHGQGHQVWMGPEVYIATRNIRALYTDSIINTDCEEHWTVSLVYAFAVSWYEFPNLGRREVSSFLYSQYQKEYIVIIFPSEFYLIDFSITFEMEVKPVRAKRPYRPSQQLFADVKISRYIRGKDLAVIRRFSFFEFEKRKPPDGRSKHAWWANQISNVPYL